MIRRLFIGALCGALLLLGAASAGWTALSKSGRAQAPLKIAFIYINPAQDGGWDTSWEKARAAAEKRFGAQIETTYKESVPPGPQFRQVVDGLIASGTKLIFSSTVTYATDAKAAARDNPDVYFVQQGVGKVNDLPNFSGFDIRSEDGFYILGMAAAAVAKRGIIGDIASFPVPQILRQINAVALGAQAINPSARVQVVATNSWFDPNKNRAAVTGLRNAGVDVIANNLSDPTIPQVAVGYGLPWTGVNPPSAGLKTNVMSVDFSFTPTTLAAIESVLNHRWRAQFTYPGMKAGAIILSGVGPTYRSQIPAAVRTRMNASIKRLRAGGYVFRGPIYAADGTLLVRRGEKLPLHKVLGMDFLVKGVRGMKVASN